MRIAISFVVQRKIRTHALRDEVLLHVLPNDCDPVLHWNLFWDGNFNFACQLRVLLALDFLYGVPKDFSICVRCRSIFAEQDFRMQDALLARVVIEIASLLIVQFRSAAVGR